LGKTAKIAAFMNFDYCSATFVILLTWEF